MKEKKSVVLVLAAALLFAISPMMGQSTKTVKEKNISSQTVYEYFIEDGIDEPVVESIERFDENGEMVELKELNSKGDVKLWEKYVYNEDGKLTEIIVLDVKGRVESTEKSIFKDGLRVEKQYFNNKDQLVKRKVYEYEYRK